MFVIVLSLVVDSMSLPVIYFDVLQHICPPAKCFYWDNKQKVWTYHISTLINESDPNGGQIGSHFFRGICYGVGVPAFDAGGG
jgi:hypothetical protein